MPHNNHLMSPWQLDNHMLIIKVLGMPHDNSPAMSPWRPWNHLHIEVKWALNRHATCLFKAATTWFSQTAGHKAGKGVSPSHLICSQLCSICVQTQYWKASGGAGNSSLAVLQEAPKESFDPMTHNWWSAEHASMASVVWSDTEDLHSNSTNNENEHGYMSI